MIERQLPTAFMRSYDRFSEADRRAIRRWYAIIGVAYSAAILLCIGIEAVKHVGPQWGTTAVQAAGR